MFRLKEMIKADPKYTPLVYAGGEIEVFTSDCVAIAFTKRATSQALWNYRFKSEAERNAYIDKYVAKWLAHEALIKANKDENKVRRAKRLREFKAQLKVGVILTDSWGYDQTNVEFYKILEVKNVGTSGMNILIQELGHKHLEAKSWASCDVVPSDELVGEPIWKQVRTGHIPIGQCISLEVWDGKPKYKSWYA